MTCLDARALAQAATSGELPPHVGDCLDCRRRLEQERAIREALRGLPVPQLSQERRRAIKAEALAAVAARTGSTLRLHNRRWPWLAAAITLAAAATLVVLLRGDVATTPAMVLGVREPVALADRHVAHDDVPPPLPAPSIEAGDGAVLAHDSGTARDAITLSDGTVEVDTRGARDVDVRIGRTVVRVDDARVRIRAHAHAVVSVEVVIGSAQVVGPDKHVTLERDGLWIAEPPATSSALAAFRDGWLALRAGRDREAVMLFDRATDPSVAEEASYWAAVATLRAGDAADARQRFTDFLARFPTSPYAAKARANLQ